MGFEPMNVRLKVLRLRPDLPNAAFYMQKHINFYNTILLYVIAYKSIIYDIFYRSDSKNDPEIKIKYHFRYFLLFWR